MLRQLRVVDFKSLEDLNVTIEDLNILIGPNNSGKTSVLQALALLKQSVHGLNLNGHMVKLGSFKDVVNGHDLNKEIVISFSLSLSQQELAGFYDERSSLRLFDVQNVLCNVTIASQSDGTAFVKETSLKDSNGRLITKYPTTDRTGSVLSEVFKSLNFSVKGFVPFPSGGEVGPLRVAQGLAQQVMQEFEHFLHYVSSRRGLGDRAEAVDGRYRDLPGDVGIYGENTIPVLAHIRDDEKYAEAMRRIRFWLEEFGLTEFTPRFSVGPTYLLEARNKQTGIQSNILDVGFGLNQLVPIIVQCFYAIKGSLIMIEQPEAHLHPKAQAKVADFLIDVVRYGNRVLVETHSEHLLLRLQRRVAEKVIDSGKIKVHYFEQETRGTKKTDMVLDKNGYFKEPIPKGFFEEGFLEALAHLKAVDTSSDQIEHSE